MGILLEKGYQQLSINETRLGEMLQLKPVAGAILIFPGTRGDDKEEEEENEDDDESLSEENLKSTLSILAVPRFQRLFKNFKNLSQLFGELYQNLDVTAKIYKDEEMEEEDLGMEIGLPTDVKHVTHIGIDGSATSIDLSALPSLRLPPFEFVMPAQADKINVTGTNQDELSALPSVHLRSFEFAMTAQADKLNVSGTNQDEFGAGNKYERPVRKKE
ncbi:hypothetical protein ACH5RR_016159 [Cinchona calisaya]|uniref:CRIB domain-containing protein n=1 Tax=Cinchona calisaya TaxID=153742 RepID=A0ABD2ZV39_9GENT